MKLRTAVKSALAVSDRIRSMNGIICTPATRFEFIRIKRAWVFGSTFKKKELPNDVDILLEVYECGKLFRTGVAKTDKEYLRRYGMRQPVEPKKVAYRFLVNNKKKISIHALDVDGLIAYPRVLIYPRNDFKSWAESHQLI